MKVLTLMLAILACSANATVIEVSNLNSGWYNQNGFHQSSNQNYIAGVGDNTIYRNFFTFDVSNITDTVTSVILQLYTSAVDESGTYSLFDVTTSIGALNFGGSNEVGIYTDLGTGINYGSLDILSDQDASYIQIDLNSNAIDAISSSNGVFALGGTYSSTDTAFGYSDFFTENKLIINTEATSATEVPEPAPLALFAFGLLGLTLYRRNVKKGS